MKRTISVLLALNMLIPILVHGQKKSNTTVPNKHAVIDALAKKYQGISSVTLSTPNGSVIAAVSVSYNESGKPYSVTFRGKDSVFTLSANTFPDVPSIQALFSSLKKQKLASGFKYSEGLSSYDNEVFVKGNIYTRFVVSMAVGPYAYGEPDLYSRQRFEISTVDFSRSGGEGAGKFDF